MAARRMVSRRSAYDQLTAGKTVNGPEPLGPPVALHAIFIWIYEPTDLCNLVQGYRPGRGTYRSTDCRATHVRPVVPRQALLRRE